jgi:hypothetical protein
VSEYVARGRSYAHRNWLVGPEDLLEHSEERQVHQDVPVLTLSLGCVWMENLPVRATAIKTEHRPVRVRASTATPSPRARNRREFKRFCARLSVSSPLHKKYPATKAWRPLGCLTSRCPFSATRLHSPLLMSSPTLEERVPSDHPIRKLCVLVDSTLRAMACLSASLEPHSTDRQSAFAESPMICEQMAAMTPAWNESEHPWDYWGTYAS